jgi:hypothetical protein
MVGGCAELFVTIPAPALEPAPQEGGTVSAPAARSSAAGVGRERSAGPRSATAAPSTPAPTRPWSPAGSRKPRPNAPAQKPKLRAIGGSIPRQMSRAEITALVTALGDITTVLRDADPADKAEVYRQLDPG